MTRLRTSPRKAGSNLGEDLELGNPPISSRGKQTPGVPGFYGPGVPEGAALPAFQFFTPEDAEKLKTVSPEQAQDFATVIERALHRAFDRFSLYTQATPFDDYNVSVVTCAANDVTRLDGPAISQGMPSRRALLIINPAVAPNVLWVGRSNVTIASGIPVAAANGSLLMALHERAPIFGIIAAQTNVPVVWFS